VVRRGYDLQLGNPVEDFVIDRVINVKENPKTTVEIKNRGVEQRIFKIELLDAYERKCAISGETTIQVLEACHIHPYQNLLSNHVQNGLLLRIDLHRLFDKGLIMIDDQYIVRIHPNLESIPTKRLTG
jgi:putative restriction endonuclease